MSNTQKALEEMFRETCYACHNAHVSSDCPPAVLTESGWKHVSEIDNSGYIICYANRIRMIAMRRRIWVPNELEVSK
jgi:hypothetical protein